MNGEEESGGRSVFVNCQLTLDGNVTAIAAYDKDYNLHDIIMKLSPVSIKDQNLMTKAQTIIGKTN